MESSLHQVWESAVGSPFVPTVGKGSQFFLGFSLLTIGFLLTGLFGLNRSVVNVPVIGIPASAAFAYVWCSLHDLCGWRLCITNPSIIYPATNFLPPLIYLPSNLSNLEPYTYTANKMSAIVEAENGPPIFKAVSSSARQLFQLLNCIRFATKAQVQISNEGLRFAVEESRVMQGTVFIEKALFTTFNCNLPESDPSDDESIGPDLPSFQISLSALLETLQIFGAADASNSRNSKPDNDGGYGSNIRVGRPNAFSNQALGMTGVCRLSYAGIGSPFSIILEESGVTTTCNLNTYEPESPEDIPFQRDAMQVKIIMQARWLFDAVTELSSTTPSRLDINAYPEAPYLSLSASGHLGSAAIEFSKGRELLETFTVAEKWTQSYKFEMIKAAAEAMRLASKVSVRGDEQGVLSLQFMVEVEGGGVSFIDFRFVPFLREEGDEDEDSQNEEDEYEGEEG
ncbi:DNA damage checkpoint control protein [Lachnellula hyalina]|uniref:DNA damage checkpoint control protein n=1 Tax=Lachnellula hyalina TaxID=1316788 RepID=A0A8H8QU63_9HELO|nr:DNA damage checkpoint control protein [Lachnellula hyalina]TVY22191.1 DNA damage checkpoint control protein [Lachnellula hyalina]